MVPLPGGASSAAGPVRRVRRSARKAMGMVPPWTTGAAGGSEERPCRSRSPSQYLSR